MKNYRIYFGFVLIAFSISQIALFVTQKITGANFIEPFLFLGFYIISRDLRFRRPVFDVLKSNTFLSSVLFLMVFFVIGILTAGDGSIYYSNPIVNCYSDFRISVLIVFIFLLVTSKRWHVNNRELFLIKILWPFILFDLVSSRILIESSQESVRVLGAVPSATIVLMSFYLKKGRYLISLALLFICGYHAVFSSSRNYMVIFFLGYLLYVYYIIFKRKKIKVNYFKRLVLLFITIVLPIILAPIVYNFWDSDPSRSIHTIQRTQQMMDSDGDTEGERLNSILLPFTDAEFYLIPNGFGWKNHIDKIQNHYKKGEVISSMDSTFYYLFYHYGFFVGFIINLSILVFVFRSFFSKINYSDQITKGFFAVLFLASFFTQSSTMALLQFAFTNTVLFALLHERIGLQGSNQQIKRTS